MEDFILRELAQGLEIDIDPTHNFFIINGRKDIYLARLLTTLKAYLTSILEKNNIEKAKESATELILNGRLTDNHIHIEIPPQMRKEEKENWKILMTIEGYHDFFIGMMFP